MTRENARSKATRYLIEGRIVITAVAPAHVTAIARGDGTLHRVTWHPHRGGWSCTCPARSDCAHLLAVRRVVAVDIDGTRTGTSARSGGGGYKAGITSCTPAPAAAPPPLPLSNRNGPNVIDQLTKGNKI